MPSGVHGHHNTPAESRAMRAAFLASYEKHMVIEDALREVGMSRITLGQWRQKYEDFRIAFEAVEAAITDQAHKMAMKHAGLLPWSEADIEARRWATSNFRAVEVLLRRDPRYRDSGINVTNNVMALTINGVKGEEIKKLVTPDSPRALLQDGTVEVMPEGSDSKPDADVGLTEKTIAESMPSAMAPLLAKRIADYAEKTAEGRE